MNRPLAKSTLPPSPPRLKLRTTAPEAHAGDIIFNIEEIQFSFIFSAAREFEEGGDEVLLTSTGKDATDDFEDVGHSSTARAMLDEYYVGDIDSSSVPCKALTTYVPPKQAQANQDKSLGFIIKLFQFLVPLVILGVAIGVRFYTKSSA